MSTRMVLDPWIAKKRAQMRDEGSLGGVPMIAEVCICGKRAYRSEHQARCANAKASFRIRVYWCPEGRSWHATAAEKR
jgi:hypothetical protein